MICEVKLNSKWIILWLWKYYIQDTVLVILVFYYCLIIMKRLKHQDSCSDQAGSAQHVCAECRRITNQDDVLTMYIRTETTRRSIFSSIWLETGWVCVHVNVLNQGQKGLHMLSLGGHSINSTQNVLKLKLTVCCLASQSFHLFTSDLIRVWSRNNESLSKFLGRSLCHLKLVHVTDGRSLCCCEIWIFIQF